MKILNRFPEGDRVIFTTRYYYYTPRVALIKYLNDPSKSHIVEWVEKGKTFKANDWNRFYSDWGWKVMDKQGLAPVVCHSYLFGSMEDIEINTSDSKLYALATKSTDIRNVVNDLNEAELYEWILLFLLEELRQDWVMWSDMNQLEFRILDIESMGRAFTQVNGPQTKNPSSVIRLILSSYCITGKMELIDSETLQYRINKKWYVIQMIKTKYGEKYFIDLPEELRTSQIRYPELTRPRRINFTFTLRNRGI